MACGEPGDVKQLGQDLENSFECKNKGELKKCMGNKINIMRQSDRLPTIKFTQLVLVQRRLYYESADKRLPKTLAVAVQLLVRGDDSGTVNDKVATVDDPGTAMMMIMMQ